MDEEEEEEMTPATVLDPPRRARVDDLGTVRGAATGLHSPSDPTGVGGRAP